MSLVERVKQHFRSSLEETTRSSDAVAEPIGRAALLVVQQLLGGGKLLACGNGGSAAQAQYLSAQMLNRYERERPGLPAMALTADTSTLTSIANDYDFIDLFAKQVRALGQPGDVLVLITTTGNSANLVAASEAAQEREIPMIVLSGGSGGTLATRLRGEDVEIRVPADSKQRIREIHLLVIHCLCDLVDRQLLGD